MQTQGAEVSIGGFIPFVGITLTDEFKDAQSDLSGGFFLTERETSLVGSELRGNNNSFIHDLALLDTGAATHILGPRAAGISGFDIDGNDFDGTNIQQIGGATGLIDLSIDDPLGVFVSGLANRTSEGNTLEINRSTFRGQSSFATLSAPEEWALPNIIGLPMAAQHKIVIRNDQPQVFEYEGRTVRTPNIELKDLGSGSEGILRRTDLKIRPGASFVSGPLYIQNLDFFSGDLEFHENPLSPTVVENAAMFLDIDMHNGDVGFEDKEFLFDTGADFTVISSLTAKRLGFDVVLDEPDFLLEVEGSGGIQDGVPGFYVDQLNIDTVGGNFTLTNVPVAVLDVTNPNDPGNIIDGIIGMHLFNGRNLVIDANPSIGQGGTGPSLYISDPVTTDFDWNSTATTQSWHTAGNWSASAVPDMLAATQVVNVTGNAQTVTLSQDAESNTVVVGGGSGSPIELSLKSGATLTTFGETKVDAGGTLTIEAGGKLDAQFINIEQGTLRGSGEIFVGTGPINSPVRNIDGRVEAGDGIGRLTIDGDFSNLAEGTVAFELAGTNVATEYDQLDVTRYAFLAGVLEVTLDAGFEPEMGDSFTLITADEAVSGRFEQSILPLGYEWSIEYNPNNVVLSVTGFIELLQGDFNSDGTVDLADYTVWRDNLGSIYTTADYQLWKSNFGKSLSQPASAVNAVPEPTSGVLSMAMLALLIGGLRTRSLRRS
ncbi:retropepsin-like aspartic protease [Aeoliella mucimassa]|nr:retropepsin-like aspartic protease [Aeoliella mucimassa]